MSKPYQTLIQSIIDTKQHYKRTDDIKLLAVSKNRNINEIKELYRQGQRLFGENYCQEAIEKICLLQDLDIKWHFIGHIQSNKAKAISEHFDWVQTLASHKVALKLNEHRPQTKGPLNVLIQVNLNQEQQKSGVYLDEVEKLCEQVAKLPALKLRGLMTIPKKILTENEQQKNYQVLTELYNKLKKRFCFDTLSMGMSGDYQAAIASGSTLLRIGRALFE